MESICLFVNMATERNTGQGQERRYKQKRVGNLRVTDFSDIEACCPKEVKVIATGIQRGVYVKFEGGALEHVLERNGGKPVETRVDPISGGKAIIVWSMKREMEKNGYNFAYVQMGREHACYDFFILKVI